MDRKAWTRCLHFKPFLINNYPTTLPFPTSIFTRPSLRINLSFIKSSFIVKLLTRSLLTRRFYYRLSSTFPFYTFSITQRISSSTLRFTFLRPRIIHITIITERTSSISRSSMKSFTFPSLSMIYLLLIFAISCITFIKLLRTLTCLWSRLMGYTVRIYCSCITFTSPIPSISIEGSIFRESSNRSISTKSIARRRKGRS